ncbi:hypothetical protein MMC11_008736 [Xylographa trunciseda]|nr:hypothetical protein [Xylographa trunciseda]
MDPLSLTASVITVVGAGSAVAKCLRKLTCIRDAPNVLLELDREIDDVRLVVATIEDRCRPRAKSLLYGNEDDNIICKPLQRTKDVVLELDMLLRYGLTKITTKGEKIDIVAWMRTESKVLALKERLRNVKLDLNIATGIMTFSSLHRLEACLHQERARIDSQLVSSYTTELQNHAANLAEPHRGYSSIVQTAEIHIKKTYLTDEDVPRERRATLSEDELDSNPMWSAKQVVMIQGMYTQFRGPELSLRVLRVRPSTSKIFRAILDKNIVIIQRLLSTGEASVLDIDERGRSLLHLALYSRQDPYSICQMLLAEGADMMQEDEKFTSPYMHVWTQFRRRVSSHDPPTQPPVGGLVGVMPDLEQIGLPELHAAVLGYGHKTFDDVLPSLSRSSINDQDRMGRTAISLAAQSGDRNMIERLLLKGADPRIVDQYGRLPVFFWIAAVPEITDFDMIDLLVDRESINHKDDTGRTILHYAVALERDSLLEHLGNRGFDRNYRDRSNWTPFHEAVVSKEGTTIVINWLIDHGADVSLQDSYSLTPLIAAATKGKHRVLKFLLSMGVDCTFSATLKRRLLHLIAIHGDLEVLEVLNRANLHSLSTDGRDSKGWTPMQWAVWRRDNNDRWSDWLMREPDEDTWKWFEAFELLCQNIDKTHASVTGPNEDASGCSSTMEKYDSAHCGDAGLRRLPGSYPND